MAGVRQILAAGIKSLCFLRRHVSASSSGSHACIWSDRTLRLRFGDMLAAQKRKSLALREAGEAR